MIAINLLPLDAWRERARGRARLIAWGVWGLAITAALAGLHQLLNRDLAGLAAESLARQGELAVLEERVTEARLITADTVREWEKLMAVLELEERRRDQARLLLEVEKVLPKDQAWLLSLSHERGVLRLEGLATDPEAVDRFLARLGNAAHLDRDSVQLTGLRPRPTGGQSRLTEFSIKARTVFSRPSLADRGLPNYGWPGRADFVARVAAVDPRVAERLGLRVAEAGWSW